MSPMAPHRNHIPYEDPSEEASSLLEDAPSPRRQALTQAGKLLGAFTLGLLLGVLLIPGPSASLQTQLQQAQTRLQEQKVTIEKLERSLSYQPPAAEATTRGLSPKHRAMVETQGAEYARVLKRANHKPASDLVHWFVSRWVSMLSQSTPHERTTTRAILLQQFVSAMAKNLNPGDYIEWQMEFLAQPWLGEVSVDFDGDGYPTTLKGKNPRDGFTQVSVCQIAMALNQAVTNAQVLLTPNIQCDAPASRISLFLSGTTLKDALTEFTTTLKGQGFLVTDVASKGRRSILIGRP